VTILGMMQVSFRYKDPREPIEVSSRFPKASMLIWCNFSVDFVEIHSPDPKDLPILTREILKFEYKGFKLQKTVSVKEDTAIITLKCPHELRGSRDESLMEEFGCLLLYPIMVQAGWAHFRVIAVDDDRLGEVLERLSKKGELEVTSKTKMDHETIRETFVIPSGEILSGLTHKQAESLLAAVNLGYYEVPRKTRFEDIAEILKVPRTTYEEHVRKAESKIINSVAPYVSLYHRQSSLKR
jgi:predicted DNA binding protein